MAMTKAAVSAPGARTAATALAGADTRGVLSLAIATRGKRGRVERARVVFGDDRHT